MSVEELKRAAKKSAKEKLEDRFLEAFRSIRPDGVPVPEPQWRFHETRKWRFDFAWPQIKLAVEVHGGSWISGRHNTGAGQAKDFEKHNAACLLGWVVLYFNTQQLSDAVGCAAVVVDMMAAIGGRQRD